MADPLPDPSALRRFFRGDLPAVEWEAIARVVERTPSAAGTLADLDTDDALLAALRHCPVLPDDPNTAALLGKLVRPESATVEFAAAVPDFPFLAPPTAPGDLGRLGEYRVLRAIGAGGMGVVFEAEDPRLGRRVALKAIRPERLAGDTGRRRFANEARAAAAVESDYVVSVHQVGEADGVPFLAMPLLRGRSLEDRLADGATLPVADVLRVGRQAAIGLAAAHARGLVHRDVKPGNLFLEEHDDGFRVKVLDFGLARAAADGDHLTRDGAVVGTPAFMAPEQARGGPVDARTDLFALGIVLYRAAVGVLPFRGTDAPSQLLAVTADAPEHPHRRNPALPPRLADLILRLLEKDPARRPRTARAVADELAGIEHEPTATPDRPPVRRRPWVALALSGLAAVLLAQVVITIRDRNGKETKLTVAAGSDVVIDADGRATVTVPGTLPTAPTAARTAAAALQPFGGLLLDAGGQIVSVGPTDPLPAGPFRIHSVGVRGDLPVTPARRLLDLVADLPDFGGVQDIEGRLTFTEADLEHMVGRPYAASLGVLSSPSLDLSDANLDHLKRFPKLTALGGRASDFDDARFKRLAANLSGLWHLVLWNYDPAGKATAAGLAELGKTRLGELYLYRSRRLTREECRAIAGLSLSHMGFAYTDFDDALLADLKGTKAVSLGLGGTKVTAAGVKAFAAAHPKCNIGWDGGIVERTLSMDTPDEPFVVLRDGHRLSAHRSLAAAVAAARSGEVIEIIGEGPHAVGNLPLVEGRDVTLRGWTGTRPRIVQSAGYDPTKPWLAVADGHLRMDGLEWSGGGWVWFSVAHGECDIRRCRLLKWDGAAAVEVGGPRLTLADSVLMAGTQHSFLALGGTERTTAEVSGCVFFSVVGNAMLSVTPNGQTVRLTGNTLVAPNLAVAIRVIDPVVAAATVTADRNLFRVESALVWPDPANPGGPKTIRWKGSGNIYPANDRIGHALLEDKRVLLGWADWQRYWGAAETNGRAEPMPVGSFFAPVRDDVADKQLSRSPAVLRELRTRFPDIGADPDRLFRRP